MATTSVTPLRIAVDTNVLLDLAAGAGYCIECMGYLRERKPPPLLMLTPTTESELGHLSTCARDLKVRRLASVALSNLDAWNIVSQALTTVEIAIADRIAAGLLTEGLLPPSEINDSFIVAEAALLRCDVLISSDGHLKNIDPYRLRTLLKQAHVKETLIVSPRLICQLL